MISRLINSSELSIKKSTDHTWWRIALLLVKELPIYYYIYTNLTKTAVYSNKHSTTEKKKKKKKKKKKNNENQ